MPAAKIDLIDRSQILTQNQGTVTANLVVEQGATFQLPLSFLNVDWTNGEFRGYIRDNYAEFDKDENGDLNPPLAQFTFINPTFVPGDPNATPDPIPDKTQTVVLLDSVVTRTLPATLNVPDDGRKAINKGYKVYDFEYEENAIVYRLFQGYVEITPESTRDNA